MSKENYEENRLRVCKIYGVDPDTVSCHHIVEKSDVKRRGKRKPLVIDFDVNQLSNLFPFSNKRKDAKALHTAVQDHRDLHRKLEAIEPTVVYSSKKKKKRRRR